MPILRANNTNFNSNEYIIDFIEYLITKYPWRVVVVNTGRVCHKY